MISGGQNCDWIFAHRFPVAYIPSLVIHHHFFPQYIPSIFSCPGRASVSVENSAIISAFSLPCSLISSWQSGDRVQSPESTYWPCPCEHRMHDGVKYDNSGWWASREVPASAVASDAYDGAPSRAPSSEAASSLSQRRHRHQVSRWQIFQSLFTHSPTLSALPATPWLPTTTPHQRRPKFCASGYRDGPAKGTLLPGWPRQHRALPRAGAGTHKSLQRRYSERLRRYQRHWATGWLFVTPYLYPIYQYPQILIICTISHHGKVLQDKGGMHIQGLVKYFTKSLSEVARVECSKCFCI